MPFSTVVQLYHGGQCTYPCFPGVLLTSTPLSKLLAAFPHYHFQNNRQQWERNESYSNDYCQSSERILAEPATSCSQVRNSTDWAMGLGPPSSRSLFGKGLNEDFKQTAISEITSYCWNYCYLISTPCQNTYFTQMNSMSYSLFQNDKF